MLIRVKGVASVGAAPFLLFELLLRKCKKYGIFWAK